MKPLLFRHIKEVAKMTYECCSCGEVYKDNHNVGLTYSVVNLTLCIYCYSKGKTITKEMVDEVKNQRGLSKGGAV